MEFNIKPERIGKTANDIGIIFTDRFGFGIMEDEDGNHKRMVLTLRTDDVHLGIPMQKHEMLRLLDELTQMLGRM